jgi:hypothetical protein
MENKKYLKISEFAKMANVSRQTIYNDLSSKLTDFVKIIDNVKYLDSEGLAVYGVKDLTPLDSQFTVKFDNDLTAFLQSQIEEKDKQIERLYSMLDKEREQSKEKDKTIQENNEHIREQEKRLADLLEQSQQLNHNNQVLLLKEKESKTKGLFKRLFAKSEE